MAELLWYRGAGVDPWLVPPGADEYWRAHAWACHRESEYWRAWAEAEGLEVPTEAFLWGNPLRKPTELQRVVQILTEQGLTIPPPSTQEIEAARRFYRGKGVTVRRMR